MRPDIVSLQSQVVLLKRQIAANRVASRKPPTSPPLPPPMTEWWVRSAEGGTYTPGADWNVNFDGLDTATTMYIDCRHPAGGGHVEIGGNSGARGFRARLVFDSPVPFTCSMGANIDSGLVQVQDNGRIQESGTSTVFALQFYKGRNCLEVFCDESCLSARFRLSAIDGILSKGVRQVIK